MRSTPPGAASRGVFWTLFEHEIRMLLRDRRTLVIAVVAPLVLVPAMLLIMRTLERSETRRLDEATYLYTVDGSLEEDARRWVTEALELALGRRHPDDAPFRFEERPAADPAALLESGELHLVVRGLTREEFRALAEPSRPAADGAPAPENDNAVLSGTDVGAPDETVPVVRLLYRADSGVSRTAASRMGDALLDMRSERQLSVYRERGLPVEPEAVAEVTARNVASAEREGGALLGLALTPLLLLLMLSGGSIVAADAIAGEKERGTLETLLTTAARRSQIVDAKMLAVIVVGLAVAVINVLNLLLYLVVGIIELPEGLAVRPEPVALFLVLLLLVPLTVLVASVLLLLSGYARSYKEYQIYFFPGFWLFILPSLAGMLPGMQLRSAIAVVPVANVGVAIREVMVGRYDWPFLFLALVSTSFAAWGLATLTGRTLSTERLISQADLDEADLSGGPALFPRHVLRWFGVMWVLLLLVSLWFGQALEIRAQVAVNILGIFLGGTLLMLWRYRLPVREALALRPVRAPVWLAVAVGAPSALLVGSGIAQLAQYVLPVPERTLESFGQFLLPEGIPLWQLVLFLAVIPGVCEELAFRGVLLFGLKRYLRPVALALAVGVIFGVFHVSLFRIIPTAYIGVLLTAVTLLTGSIFPAIAWHALSNAVALVPAHLGWVDPALSVDPLAYLAAGVGLAFSFWVLWRERTPYPGLRRPPREMPYRRPLTRRRLETPAT